MSKLSSICVVFFHLLVFSPAIAQVVPDTTLPSNSLVTQQGGTSIINGGTRAGSNLFHSFQQFSVLTRGTAYFNNALSIQNIIGRITGSSISNVDGLIRANGTANLFLLNPNGIIFGRNATLNIGGSFLASTAISMKFADGIEFSATVPPSASLLTISVPVGLQFGQNPAPIQVQGTGHNLVDPIFSPIQGRNSSYGLRVHSGQNLALIAGNITLASGVLAAEGGHLELGSVKEGLVNFDLNSSIWKFNYGGVNKFGSIELLSKALIDTSSPNNKVKSGSIRLDGANISLFGASVILDQNQSAQTSGEIIIEASESLRVGKFTGTAPSGLFSETAGTGQGSNLFLSAPQFMMDERSSVVSRTYGLSRGGNISVLSQQVKLSNESLLGTTTTSFGKGGTIEVRASESFQASGVSPNTPSRGSGIISSTLGLGEGGDINLSTQKLTLNDGASIGARVQPRFLLGDLNNNTNLNGKGGNVVVDAKDFIQLIGTGYGVNTFGGPKNLQPTLIESTTFSSVNAGDVTINTSKLLIQDGAELRTDTFERGHSGNLLVSASDFVEIKGKVYDLGKLLPSTISSSNNTGNGNQSPLIFLPGTPITTGVSGTIKINTPKIRITDGAKIAVSNGSISNAGSIQINTNTIKLERAGSITATTASGEGGNIYLNARNLQLRHNSLITAAAQGSGNGGNITINTGTLAALENSNIDANAFMGRGGNIQINAQGVFRSPNSTITATGIQSGINGTVQVNTLVNNATLGLATLPIIPVEPTKLIAQGCRAKGGPRANKFVVIGSGGLPTSPNDSRGSDTAAEDWGKDTAQREDKLVSDAIANYQRSSDPDEIVKATGWVTDAKGQVIALVAKASTLTTDIPWLKSASCHDR